MLVTERLRLRAWTESDLKPFAELNADPHVMEFFPEHLDRAQSDALVGRIRDHFRCHGFGLWAVEAPGVADLVGYVGLSTPGFAAPFTPCIEIGWRLRREYWGRGYATEGAIAAFAFAFNNLALDEIVSFTVPANIRSTRVMERLGMTRLASDDFDHPSVPEGHPLRRHVLYRRKRTAMSAD